VPTSEEFGGQICLEIRNSEEFCGQICLKIRSRHCIAAFCLQVPKSCTDLDQTLLYISIGNLLQIFTGKWNDSTRRLLAAAKAERWPQVCHVKIMSEWLLTICFLFTITNLMKCLVNWISPNSNVRFEQNPTLPTKFKSDSQLPEKQN